MKPIAARVSERGDSRPDPPQQKDAFIEKAIAASIVAFCDRGRLEMIEEATHWLQHEEPERVNRLLIGFLREEARIA